MSKLQEKYRTLIWCSCDVIISAQTRMLIATDWRPQPPLSTHIGVVGHRSGRGRFLYGMIFVFSTQQPFRVSGHPFSRGADVAILDHTIRFSRTATHRQRYQVVQPLADHPSAL